MAPQNWYIPTLENLPDMEDTRLQIPTQNVEEE